MTDELNQAEYIEQLIGSGEAVKLVVSDDDGTCTVTAKKGSFAGTAYRPADGKAFVMWADGSTTSLDRLLQIIK
jgi:hypothetical protein